MLFSVGADGPGSSGDAPSHEAEVYNTLKKL